jgi:hypothetical protein
MNKILILILMIVSVSCNSNKQKTDNDVVPDSDKDTETIDETTDKTSDVPDETSDETPDEAPDAPDENPVVECLDLRVQENVIKTPFPFKDKDGRATFCRPGCDTPTENDPQCVRNIWEWDNWEKHQKYLAAQKADPEQTSIRECYPWPCKLPDMKANANLESFNSKCDRWLTVNGYEANMGIYWSHGMSDGVAGMDFAHSGRIIEYDPEKDEYTSVGQSLPLMFNENRYVAVIYDQLPYPSNFTNKQFVISVLRKNGEYFYELIYDNNDHNAWLSGPSFPGKNWVLIQVSEGRFGSKTEFKYASSKDWEWHNIEGIMNYTGEGNIAGDHLTFITNNRDIYYCDLRKYPKHINDCVRINRPSAPQPTTLYEKGHSPKIDTENEKRLVYNVFRENKFVEVDLSDIENPVYSEYEIEKNKETSWDWEIDKVTGNKVVYSEAYIESGLTDFIACFYRFDKKKVYCPKEDTSSTDPRNLMGYNTFWGKWHLWKRIGRPSAVMRDWECYCEESGVCPLEE